MKSVQRTSQFSSIVGSAFAHLRGVLKFVSGIMTTASPISSRGRNGVCRTSDIRMGGISRKNSVDGLYRDAKDAHIAFVLTNLRMLLQLWALVSKP